MQTLVPIGTFEQEARKLLGKAGVDDMLIVGLASVLSASMLLMMTLVIETFVYPDAWATHLGWATALTFMIFRGQGTLSIDYCLRKHFRPHI